MNESETTIENLHRPAWRRCAETALLFLLFFLFAGSEPPGVNESHYLCKAKHYWNPDWCRDDLFLNSADAHAVFYWTFGWLTLFASLPTTAWIGRAVVWLLQAWAWRRLSWSIVPRPWFSLLSAAVFLALIKHGHMAGEWVVGDVEAKGIAYVLVFLGLEALVRGRWHWTFPLFGAAAAFHVIVGGWAVVAGGVAWLLLRNSAPKLVSLAPSLLLGFLLSLPGLLPCLLLDRGAPPEVVEQGNVVYVYARLNHHLVVHRFAPEYLVRFACLAAATGALAFYLRNVPRLKPLFAFTTAAVLIAVVGVVIDQSLVYASPEWPARLLRYYWYRLSDSTVPLTAALSLCWLAAGFRIPTPGQTAPAAKDSYALEKPPNNGAAPWQSWLACALIALGAWNIVDTRLERAALGVPPSAKALGNPQAVVSLAQRHHDWMACCNWIRRHTDSHASFLTPRGQQTFKWYAHRAEVVSWKDAPQDAASLVAWLKRYEDVHPHPSGTPIMFGPEIDPQLPPDERLPLLAKKYNAQYVVVDRLNGQQPMALARVYPVGDQFNLSFAVYRVGP